VNALVSKNLAIENNWYSGDANILTYSLEELLGTKLRALYQRKKGRDLYDLWVVSKTYPELDHQKVIDTFIKYLEFEDLRVTRAQMESNLAAKREDPVFMNDIFELLSGQQANHYTHEEAFLVVQKNFIQRLVGKPWEKEKT